MVGRRTADSLELVAVFRADVAQLVEHSLGKGEVTSSILVISSIRSAVSFQLSAFRLCRGRFDGCGRRRQDEAES